MIRCTRNEVEGEIRNQVQSTLATVKKGSVGLVVLMGGNEGPQRTFTTKKARLIGK